MLPGQLPARLTAEQVAWVLNCQPHDVPILVAARLLKPLGNSPSNGTEFFVAAEIFALGSDRNWLARVTCAIQHYWHRQNARKPPAPRNGAMNGLPAAVVAADSAQLTVTLGRSSLGRPLFVFLQRGEFTNARRA